MDSETDDRDHCLQTVRPELVKKERIVDLELLETVRNLPCMACQKSPRSHPHHIKTVKSGGDDVAENVVALCPAHHVEIHSKGIDHMANKYPLFFDWLFVAGWVKNEFGRWKRMSTNAVEE